jgi:acetyltransferase-like isoleucine patch superfamily enzyme
VNGYTHDNVARTLDGSSPIERSPTTIRSNVYVGPNAVITRGLSIGDCVLIGANSLVSRDVPSGARSRATPRASSGACSAKERRRIEAHARQHRRDARCTSPIERSPTTIGKNVYAGTNAVITHGPLSRDRVLIGANGLVTSDVPSGAEVVGDAAGVIGSVERVPREPRRTAGPDPRGFRGQTADPSREARRSDGFSNAVS